MKRFAKDFRDNIEGQDLSEYTLCICFLAVLGLALYITLGSQVKTIWTQGNATVTTAALAAR